MMRVKTPEWICLSLACLFLGACSPQNVDEQTIADDNVANHAEKSKSSPQQTSAVKATPSAESSEVYIVSPVSGATVDPTFKVVFGLSGMGVAPAGIDKENTGHHHLLIDLEELPDMSLPLPATESIVHFGGGQTETWVTLSPGQHTLQLLLGDFVHRPHSTPVLSEPIIITVKSQ